MKCCLLLPHVGGQCLLGGSGLHPSPEDRSPGGGDGCLRAYSWDLVAVNGIFLTDVVYLFHQKLLFDSVQ